LIYPKHLRELHNAYPLAPLRAEAKTETAKSSFKLMNNAVYGKTMENIFKHKNIEFITETDPQKMDKKILKKVQTYWMKVN
jgi:hypothetical protein